jgi:hypothetical protein
LIDFTRGTRKSQARSGCKKGAIKPPLAPSTWMGIGASSLPQALVIMTWLNQEVNSHTGNLITICLIHGWRSRRYILIDKTSPVPCEPFAIRTRNTCRIAAREEKV